jgi:F-type H+-transporting ATPase subunit epsilon
MYEKSFTVEIVAPDRIVYRGDATSVSAPGVEGGFQVLYNHAPLMAALEIGRVTVKDPGGTDTVYSTAGGFLEVRDNKVTVLVESAEVRGGIDVARAESACERARERLRTHDPGIDVERARLALLRALNRIRVAGRG